MSNVADVVSFISVVKLSELIVFRIRGRFRIRQCCGHSESKTVILFWVHHRV